MTKALAHPPHNEDLKELTKAFRLTARYSGNATRAAEELGMKPATLQKARQRNRDLYNKIAAEELENIRLEEAEQHIQVSGQARDLVPEVVAQAKQKLAAGDIPARDLGGLARNLAVVSGTHLDKALLLLGEHQAGIQVNINLGDLAREWASQGSKFYDSDGNEIPPEKAQQVIEGKATEIADEAN